VARRGSSEAPIHYSVGSLGEKGSSYKVDQPASMIECKPHLARYVVVFRAGLTTLSR
jgi:hypothetical protein